MRSISRKLLFACAAMAMLVAGAPAKAAVIQLTFEGLKNLESINGFYNGGTGSQGSVGPNLGVEFSSDSLAIIDSDAGGTGNIGGEPSPSTAMFFLNARPLMNVAAGFTTGFSTYYSAITNPGSLQIWDGLNGTGNVLAFQTLATTPNNGAPDPTGSFSPFVRIGLTFSGIAKSVVFGGAQNQIAFDNVTFGSDNPDTREVPEPSTMVLLGLGSLGLILSRRKIAAV